ncbi:MAG: thioredoxin family protein [Oscillospiraceae bacterium]|nr:thioredoxin family protein [Oscillospiraceae bacterium]
MIDMNHATFQNHMEDHRPVLVEFWAPWCVYCRRIAPAMEKVAEQAGGLTVGRVNIDEEPLLSAKEQIEVIPTLVLYREGKALGSIVAPESRDRIEAFVRETLGG